MPFALPHRPSKKELRRPAPTLLELRQSLILTTQKPLPTPPSSADSATLSFSAASIRPASTLSATTSSTTPAATATAGERTSKMFPWIKKRSASSSADVPRSAPAKAVLAAAAARVDPPKPILKAAASAQDGQTIRFAGQRRSVSAGPTMTLASGSPVAAAPPRAPSLIITDFDDPSGPVRAPTPIQPAQMRRSSRPASPSAHSFGARTRVQSEPVVSTILPATRVPRPAAQVIPESQLPPTPTTTPPAVHVTTPPTAYVSSMQTRAPPPPSPYRPTVPLERQALGKTFAPLPLTEMEAVAARPPRFSSLLHNRPALPQTSAGNRYESPSAFADLEVPVFNIIPATPQEESEDFPVRPGQATRAIAKLEDAAEVMDKGYTDDKPELAELEFTPFSMPVKLPSSSSIYTMGDRSATPRPDMPSPNEATQGSVEHSAPALPLPPSPPLESYPSLPSLSSHGGGHHSMPSIDSTTTDLMTSDSHASLRSFADVEEALGSMLASLSQDGLQIRANGAVEYGDQQVIDLGTPTEQWQPTYKPRSPEPELGLGYGLSVGKEEGAVGLGLGLVMEMPQIERITAPLAPRRRVPAPQPLDMAKLAMHTRAVKASLSSSSSTSSTGSNSSLSSFDRHRKAFYTSTKPAPSTSPTYGIFPLHFPMPPSESTVGAIGLALGELDLPSIEVSDVDERDILGKSGNRDSISVGSEASDDDVHSASIVCLTPVLTSAGGGSRMEYREEVMLPSPEVGVAL